ncbi:MAG TPA: helix-turn-helix domain-containing protein [Anaerolineales bacterium]|nr:helix-turn-helix domain-containing protein [Anaerolineales bacterium]
MKTLAEINVDPKKSDDFELKVQKRLSELEIEQDILTLRQQLGLTQSQLAEIAGVSQPFIAKLESGRAVNIELRTLVRIATALDAQVDARIRRANTERPVRKPRKVRKLSFAAGRR